MNLSEAITAYLPLIEAEMRDLLTPAEPAVARHYEIMQYHMGWRDPDLQPAQAPAGKRIRPLLCLLAAAAAGGDPQVALPVAAGLELLHNFSLLHDDIEDNSPTRRHRPTAWRLFGMPIACNAGDGMFSLAHLAFFRLAQHGVSADRILAALHRFDETCLALTDGQYLDMSFEVRLDVTPEEYYRMIAGKTGALLAAAPELGALVAGAELDVVAAYRAYGAALGRAFQLQDDILGIWGDEAETGKSTASDILSKKKSLPVVYALGHPRAGSRLRALYAGADFAPADVPAVLSLLEEVGARGYTEAEVRRATAAAYAALATVGVSSGPLVELLEMLTNRKS